MKSRQVGRRPGRPPLYPDDPLVEIVAKVRGSVAEELRVRAAADYRSVSSLVRIIIDKALQEET